MVWPSIKGSLREPHVKGTGAGRQAKAVPPTSGPLQVVGVTPCRMLFAERVRLSTSVGPGASPPAPATPTG